MASAMDSMQYFNPHSHKGSDEDLKMFEKEIDISIHTPTRGVTETYWHIKIIWNYFNPHSHKGSDDIKDLCTRIEDISIHTPTRGVTSF